MCKDWCPPQALASENYTPDTLTNVSGSHLTHLPNASPHPSPQSTYSFLSPFPITVTWKVWKVATGHCLLRFDSTHSKGVTSVEFSRDASYLLSCSFDATIK